jgi:chromosome segregation ATPase
MHRITESLAQLLLALGEMKRKAATQQQHIEHMKNEQTNAISQCDVKTTEVGTLVQEIANLNQQVQAQEAALQACRDDCARQQSEQQRLQAELNLYKQKILSKAGPASTAEGGETSGVASLMAAYQSTIAELQQTLAMTREKVGQTQAQAAELMAEAESIQSRFDTTKAEQARALDEIAAEMATCKKELENAENDAKDTAARLAQEEAARQQLEEKKAELETRCDTIDEEMKSSKFSKSKVEREKLSLEKEAKKREAVLRAACDENTKLQSSLEDLKAEVTRLSALSVSLAKQAAAKEQAMKKLAEDAAGHKAQQAQAEAEHKSLTTRLREEVTAKETAFVQW